MKQPSVLLLSSVFSTLVWKIVTETPDSSTSLASTRHNNRLFLLPPSIFFSGPASAPITPTVTKSSLTTVTKTETTSIVCAKLVNVTGPCLKRKGAWVEEPIVLSFHGDFDDTFDFMYSPVLE